MDVAKYDKNFARTQKSDIEFDLYDTASEPFTLYGGFCEAARPYERLPDELSRNISDGVHWASGCAAGLRLTFATDAKRIKLQAVFRDKCLFTHMAVTGGGSFNLVCEEDGKDCFVGNFMPDFVAENKSVEGELELKGGSLKKYVLFFPLYCGVDEVYLSFDKGAAVKPYKKYDGLKRILYYGSSITHGGCASRADNTYPQLISEWTNTDYTLLGFSGNALAEDGMLDYLKNSDCDLFVCDYDHNAPSVEYLADTHEKLYNKFKENPSHKNVPVIFLSAPDGLRLERGDDRYRVIEKTYLNAKARGDEVYLIDGRTFYPEDVREHCSVDGCHPTDLGFYFMAKAVYPLVIKVLKIESAE